jgi:tol-pal system protein YbgF
LAIVPGCGTDQLLQIRHDLTALRDELAEMKRSQTASRIQYDELRNRLILIEDKTDSEKVARARRDEWIPRLPTVRVDQAGRSGAEAQERAQADEHVDARDRVGLPSAIPRMGAARKDMRTASQLDSQTIHLTHDDPLPGENVDEPIEVSGPADEAPPQASDAKPKLDPTASLYEKGKSLFDQGQIAESRRVFEALHRQYPRHDLADNALYWIGEGYYAQAQWLTSAQAFLRVAKEYPRGNKVPDAMLKMALCYRKLGDDHGADDVLKQLTRLYPGTEAADKATAMKRAAQESQP